MRQSLERYLMKVENQQALETNLEWKLNRMREEYDVATRALRKAYAEIEKLRSQLYIYEIAHRD